MALQNVIQLEQIRDNGEVVSIDLSWLSAYLTSQIPLQSEGSVLSYLGRYLAGIGAMTAVVESDYVDRDYLADYTQYYAKCLSDYPRKCYRIHFFSKRFEKKHIIECICPSDFSEEALKRSRDKIGSYLGFVVIRPLHRTVVGRTCLLPYPTKETERYYPSARKIDISLLGLDLSLQCMPFQEQDSSTAACATCALWSAFQVTAELFGHKTYSPSDITSLAVEHGLSEMRQFPNGGLYGTDMLYAIRRIGLDPVSMDIGINGQGETKNVNESDVAKEEKEQLSIFLGTVYAYLGMGIPIVLTGNLEYGNGERYGDGGHAVTLNGYHLVGKVSAESSWLVSDGIDKMYVHDDQIGPSARITLDSGNVSRWHTEWRIGDKNLYFVPLTLMIPVYHKIRVTYEDIYKCVFPVSVGMAEAIKLLKEKGRIPKDFEDVLKWDIVLQKSKEYKKTIRMNSRILRERRQKCLETTYSKYVWVLSVLVKGEKQISFIVDATDSGQGLKAVDMIIFSHKLAEVFWAMLFANQDDMDHNPLLQKMTA